MTKKQYKDGFVSLLSYIVQEMIAANEMTKSSDPDIIVGARMAIDVLKDMYLHVLGILDIDLPDGASVDVNKQGQIFVNGKEIQL